MDTTRDTAGLSGTVFDVQRCSMHDGPGIRTTVFLKGCPLSCKWCHNPESQKHLPQLAYYSEKCIGCLSCSRIHPQVHTFGHPPAAQNHTVDYARCRLCGRCVDQCPAQALKIFGFRQDIKSIMEMIVKDIPYYQETGGGLTVSGGEPFLQYSFLLGLLKAAKEQGISTCVETCGQVSRERLTEAMEYIDYFLYDYKETSPTRHKEFTGMDNTQILANLDYLYRSGKQITLRCPIIPGYNDTPEHFQGIAEMEKRYPGFLGIEIMPYHDLGKTKAYAIGADYKISPATADNTLKAKWKDALNSYGCSAKILESF